MWLTGFNVSSNINMNEISEQRPYITLGSDKATVARIIGAPKDFDKDIFDYWDYNNTDYTNSMYY